MVHNIMNCYLTGRKTELHSLIPYMLALLLDEGKSRHDGPKGMDSEYTGKIKYLRVWMLTIQVM